MLATNIETRVSEILSTKGKGGWLRAEECADEYAKDKITGEINGTQKTKFYRWRKQVEKGKVSGFRVLKLQGNISYIGLENANPTAISTSEIDKEREKRLEAIRNANLSNPIIAYFDLLLFIDTLPSHIKDKLGSDLQIATVEIMKANEWRPFEEQTQKQERLRTFISIVVLYFINKIPILLNEEFGKLQGEKKT